MNHNLVDKILDIKVLLEWRDKIRIVNQSYHESFLYDDKDGCLCGIDKDDQSYPDYVSNYRSINRSYVNQNIYNIWVNQNIYNIWEDIPIAKLPDKYIYSSGMISLEGFK